VRCNRVALAVSSVDRVPCKTKQATDDETSRLCASVDVMLRTWRLARLKGAGGRGCAEAQCPAGREQQEGSLAMHSWLLGPRKVRQPTIIRLFSAKTLCTLCILLHAARHSHHAPTTTVNRFLCLLCLLCLFHCLDFLYCLILLRDPALKQALFVHCPFRPMLTKDAPPNYPTHPV
jgi:hypothetical protein